MSGPATAEEDAALAKIATAVDDVQKMFVKPMQAIDKTDLAKFRVDPADVAALGDESDVSVTSYSGPQGDGWETTARLVKGDDVYVRSYQKGPDVSRTHRLVGSLSPGPMTKNADGTVEDADVPTASWVEIGWQRAVEAVPVKS